jgi:hypothetical protein
LHFFAKFEPPYNFKKMKYLLILSLGGWLWACNAASSPQRQADWSAASPTHSPEVVRKEITALYQTLQKYHPGLYRYTPKSALDSSLAIVLAQVKQPMNSVDLVKLLSPWVAQIKCGHTQIGLDETMQKTLLAKAKLFPLAVQIIQNQLIISQKSSLFPQLAVGSRILRINGEKVADLLPRMLKYISAGADGDNLSGKIRYLEQHFAYWYGLLDSFASDTYIIDYQPFNSKSLTLPLYGITWENYQNREQNRGVDIPLRFDQLPEFGAAILRIKTFDKNTLRRAKQDFPEFLHQTFATLARQKTQNLILDLRDNGGGDDDFALLLLSYLLNQPFKMYAYLEVTSHYQGFGKISVAQNGKFLHTSHPNLYTQMPKKNAFVGKIYTLINGASFSATAEVAAVLHHHHRAIFIGEETGGGYTGNTSGLWHTLLRKDLGLKIRIPQWAYYLAVEQQSRRGVLPDCSSQTTASDLSNQIDRPLWQAFELIKNQPTKELGINN